VDLAFKQENPPWALPPRARTPGSLAMTRSCWCRSQLSERANRAIDAATLALRAAEAATDWARLSSQKSYRSCWEMVPEHRWR
jgi:hypothetical protein